MTVVSPALLRGQAGGARGRALQVSSTVSQGGVNTPVVPAPGAAVDSGQVESGAGIHTYRVEGGWKLLYHWKQKWVSPSERIINIKRN